MAIAEVLKKLNSIDVTVHEGDAIGNVYESLISQFVSGAGKKAEEFYTSHQVLDTMTQIVTSSQEDRKLFSVFDPTMGSSSLMLDIHNYLNHPKNVKYHG